VKGGTQVGARVELRECPTHHNVGMLENLQHILTAQVNGQLDLLIQLDVHPHPLILYIVVCVGGGGGGGWGEGAKKCRGDTKKRAVFNNHKN